MRKHYFLWLLAALLVPLGAKAQITEFPYSASFETTDLGGWTIVDADGDGYNWTRLTYNNLVGHDGSYFMQTASYDNSVGVLTPDNWLISPAITLENAEMTLSWWVRVSDINYPADHYGVFVSTTGNTPDDFPEDPIFESTLTAAYSDWVKAEVSLADYAGQTVYIAFRHYDCSDWYQFMIDDVVVDAPAACAMPNGLVVEAEATSATVTFNMPSSATGVKVYLNGQYHGTATTGSYYIDNLTSGSTYTLELQSICGDNDSSDIAFTAFNTECVTVTEYPWYDFINDDLNCWIRESMYWHLDAGIGYTGDQGLRHLISTSSAEKYAITPDMTLPTGMDNLVLEFYAATSGSTPASFQIYVSPTASTEFDESYTLIVDTTMAVTNYWVNYKFNIAEYGGQTVRFAIKHTSETSSSVYLYLDDFAVRSTDMPVVSMPAAAGANINMAVTLNATLVEGDTNSLSWVWTSTMAAAGDATFSDNGSSIDITYTAVGTDTVTVTATNSFGSSTATAIVSVFDLNPVAEFPYSTSFDSVATDNSSWITNNGANGWYIGSAADSAGSAALYISNDNGTSNSYDISNVSNSYAYRVINIANPGDYIFNFDWRAAGESTYDYLRVFLAPADEEFSTNTQLSDNSLPAGYIALDGGSKLNLNGSSWTTHTAVAAIETSGMYKLTFYWRNDGSVGSQPPAAVDNVGIIALSCTTPLNLTVDSIGLDVIGFHWTAGGEETQWLVQVGDSISEVVGETSYTAENLQLNTLYDITVSALCSESDTSLAATTTARTLRVLVPAVIPYQTGFEATDDNAYWFIDNSINGWYIDTAVNNGGSNALFISNDNGATNAYSIGTGCISLAYRHFRAEQTGEYAFSYDWRAYGEGNYDFIRVFLVPANAVLPTVYSDITYGSLPAGYTALDGGNKLNLSSTWQTEMQTASITDTGLYMLVFCWRNDNSSGTMPPAAIDNVQISLLTCPRPTAIELDSAGTDYLAFHWTAGGDETSWEVTVGDAAPVVVNSTSYTATGLAAATHYSVGVRAICGEGDSSLAAVTDIATACGAVAAFPWTEGFENHPANASPECWTVLYGYTTSNYTYPYVYNSSYSAHSGTMSIYDYMSGYSSTTSMFVSPVFDAPANTLTGSLWIKAYSYYYDDYNTVYTDIHMEMGVMTDLTDTNTFVAILDTMVNTGSSSWAEISFSAEASGVSGNAALAFRFSMDDLAEYGYVYIDDITVNNDGTADTTTPGPGPGPQPVVCNAPTITASPATDTTITVVWSGTANSYEVAVVEGTWSAPANGTATAGPSYTFTGLQASTQYSVGVRSVCDDTVSAWAIRSVTTAAAPSDTTDTTGIRLASLASFSLYPNPATSTVAIDLGSEGHALVAIIDQSGRTCGVWTVESGKLEINVSDMAKGAYFVRATTNAGTSVRKLIVK